MGGSSHTPVIEGIVLRCCVARLAPSPWRVLRHRDASCVAEVGASLRIFAPTYLAPFLVPSVPAQWIAIFWVARACPASLSWHACRARPVHEAASSPTWAARDDCSRAPRHAIPHRVKLRPSMQRPFGPLLPRLPSGSCRRLETTSAIPCKPATLAAGCSASRDSPRGVRSRVRADLWLDAT